MFEAINYSLTDMLLAGVGGMVLGVIIQGVWEAFAPEECADHKREELLSGVIPAIRLLQEYIEETGGCDHSVGICFCDDKRVLKTAINSITSNTNEPDSDIAQKLHCNEKRLTWPT